MTILTERREEIRELLRAKPFVSLDELQKRFPDISQMTLRRDLDYFEENNEIIKVRGGARSLHFLNTTSEETFVARMGENPHVKEKLAHAAVAFLETGRSIFLDSGTTMLALARAMPDMRLNITTTGLNIAQELICQKTQPVVNAVGGQLSRDNISTSGIQAQRFLEDINIDIAFLVPSGVSLCGGFSCGNYTECETKRLVFRKARHTVILFDSSKLDRSMPYTFAAFEGVHMIITDKPLPEEMRLEAQRQGVRVLIAD